MKLGKLVRIMLVLGLANFAVWFSSSDKIGVLLDLPYSGVFITGFLSPVMLTILWGYKVAKDEVSWVCQYGTPIWRKISLSEISFDALLGSFFTVATVGLAPVFAIMSTQVWALEEFVLGALLGWLVGFLISIVSGFVTAFYYSWTRKKIIGWYHA